MDEHADTMQRDLLDVARVIACAAAHQRDERAKRPTATEWKLGWDAARKLHSEGLCSTSVVV